MTHSDQHTAATGRQRRLRVLLVLIAVCLTVLCGTWLMVFGERHAPARQAEHASASGNLSQSVIEVIDSVPIGVSSPPTGLDNAPDVKPSPLQERYARVRFVQDTSPATSVEVVIQLLEKGRLIDRRGATADQQGELILRLPRASDEMVLNANDERFRFPDRRVGLTQDLVEVEVLVTALIAIELSVAYDDGLPFSGEASFVCRTADPVRPTQVHAENGDWKSGGDAFQVVGGKRTLTGIIATDCELWFYTNRAGYDRYTEKVLARDLTDGARLTITIKPSKYPMGCLILDFGDKQWERPATWSYALANISQPMFRQSSSKSGPPESNKFTINPLLEGEYRAWVACESLCWQQIIQIKAGQTTEVAVKLTPECQVTVNIQDESGRPFLGAVVLPDTGDVPTFPARPRRGFIGVSNASGLATLDGLTSDTNRILVAAEGYEPVSLPVSLNSGVVSTAGTVRLLPAEGKITIRVVHAQPGVQYAAMYNHPSGRGGRSPSQFVGSTGETVFDRLPLRQYLVAVSPAGGGKLVTRLVTLSPQEREAVVELDVSSLNPAPQEK